MSFHGAAKINLNRRDANDPDRLRGWKWFLCLLKLAPHIVTKTYENDPGGVGYSKCPSLDRWMNK